MMAFRLLAVVLALLAGPSAAWSSINIVAAENFYGGVAQQLAGTNAAVSSILSNPDQDPHLFEASPSVARLLSNASIVIYNGAGYDEWMTKLLSAVKSPDREVIVLADLVHKKAGDNPHLWYDPLTMTAYARALVAALSERDPTHKSDYDRNLRSFLDTLQPLNQKIIELRSRYGGINVAATEPVFNYMAAALGFSMRDERFQLAVMNDTEPRASDVAAFETDLREHIVALLYYNKQATDPVAQRMVRLAKQSRITVVGVTETQPVGKNYQEWMLSELEATAQALSTGPS